MDARARAGQRVMRIVAACMAALACAVLAADGAHIASFSAGAPGSRLPPGWREQGLPRKKLPEFALVADEGVTVLRVHSDSAAGTALHPLSLDPVRLPRISWRWKIDHVVERANLEERSGDDFAARVYVFFDVPIAELEFSERVALRLARLVYGQDLPTAGICYVWDNRHPVGTLSPSPYTSRVRTLVLESGNGHAGKWRDERRDLEADFRSAFGGRIAPRVTGIALGNDTDQTHESVTAWFGDVKLEAQR
jgi:Protein of unknown function (DUF3047)